MLSAIFERRGMLKDNTYTELSKQVLLMILKECGIIKAPEKKVAVPKDDAQGKGKKGGAKSGKADTQNQEESNKADQSTPPEQLY